MKFIQYILVVAVLGFILTQFLPWWSIAIAGFAAPWIVRRGYLGSFMGGFLGIFLLWMGMAMWITMSTGSPLPDQVAQLISYEIEGNLLAVLTGVVGGLVAGLASLSARILRK